MLHRHAHDRRFAADSQRYLGRPYPVFSGNPDETRVILRIAADSIHAPMG
ncbi:hypothetical protein [Actinomycetospora soli]|nr:hypothetical protein [Actinomycetospora soli]MCD2189815.1 hypothetical protein [Actinomycetospora soli]